MSDAYPLTRGSKQLTRVNLLQFIWRDTLGYLIHPGVLVPAKACIADVATATGVWLCEAGRELPTAEHLHGFDISSQSFIRPDNLPGGVVLRESDATRRVPDELTGQYDLVHVRLLQPAVHNDDPTAMIKHCKDLLKPGGYLQWEEFDPLALSTAHAPGIPRPSKLDQLQQRLQSRAPSTWIASLPSSLQDHGFSTVAVERTREATWHRLSMTSIFCDIFDEFADTFLDRQGPPGSGDEVRTLTKEVYAEGERGSYASHLFQVVVARRDG